MTQDLVKLISLAECQSYLTARNPHAHKGVYGHVLVIGGDYGMGGAPRLAGEAALRSGTGIVSIATRPEHAFAITGSYPELMCHGIKATRDCLALFSSANVIAIGPGLGQSSWGEALLQLTLKNIAGSQEKTLVIDADALNLISKSPMLREYLQSKEIQHPNWILTPHPGEAARLLDCSTSEVQHNRIKAIKALHQSYRGTIVLKGSGTLVLGSSYIIRQCSAGNPGMATAGMGDILTGIIAGLAAQSIAPEYATSLGVCAHATAGDILVERDGQRGLNARDILGPLRTCLNPM